MPNSTWISIRDAAEDANSDHGGGAGSALNPAVLISAGVATIVATVVSVVGILFQLKNYRKPLLQRMTVRIMVMVPLYAISSLISLFSLNAAFAIDAIRDIYEAFVIYNFFSLIVAYLGGERSVLILLYGRSPRSHFFPINLFVRELDISDPFTFLFLKRGILQYVQVKPILTAATLVLKATGTYKEGELSWSAGYVYISFVYNISICLSLYCLAAFWVCVNADIKPFRPMPKFLCVKGILFFSFWQAITISALVAAGVIKQIGPYTDSEHISLAITDTLICYEMPFFAFAHWFAFSHTDYIDKHLQYAARMSFYYALRDAFGMLDVFEDSRETLRGGMDYRTFEPVEGGMHQGIGRDRRIKAGLRYSKGGQKKYWLPMPQESSNARHTGPISALKIAAEERHRARYGYAPILDTQTDRRVFHDEILEANTSSRATCDQDNSVLYGGQGTPVDEIEPYEPDQDEWTRELTFEDPDPVTERLFADSRRLLFGDYHYPCIDVSSEEARRRMWEEEEQILKDQRAAFGPPVTHPSVPAPHPSLGLLAAAGRSGLMGQRQGYGAVGPNTGDSLGESPASRSRSDPNPNAARSQKGKTSTAISGSSSGRKGVYGGWAEHADLPSASTSHVQPHSTAANNTPTIAEHHPSIPVIDYTPQVTDPTKGAIDMRYARTTTRLPAPAVPSAPTTTTQGGLGLDYGNTSTGKSAYHALPAPLPRPSSVASASPTPTTPATSSESSPPDSAAPLRPEVGSHNGGKNGRRRRGPSPHEFPRDAIDLVVEDVDAKEDEMTRERRKGEPAVRQAGERRIYRREYVARGGGPADHEYLAGGYREKEILRDAQVMEDEFDMQTSVSGATEVRSARHRSVMEEHKVTVRDEDGQQEAQPVFNASLSIKPQPSVSMSAPEALVDYAAPELHESQPSYPSPHAVVLPRAVVFKVGDEALEGDSVLETTPLHTRVLLLPPDDDIVNPWA